MPRYELVEGKSSKFWEVEVEGVDVHLAWGRIGTSGQQKTKTFASAAKATAERDKLVKQKTGKGYAEVGPSLNVATGTPVATEPAPKTTDSEMGSESETDSTPATAAQTETASETEVDAATPTPTDEDALTLPRSWLQKVHPRRGYPSAAALRGGDAPNAKKSWAAIRAHFVPRQSETWSFTALPERLAAARRFLERDEPPTPDDPGVQAVVARIMGYKRNYDDKPITGALVDYWIARRGVELALRAGFETLSLQYGNGTELHPPSAQVKAGHWAATSPTVFPRLRRRLCVLDDDAYRAARDLVAGFRDAGDEVTRAVAAFLFPSEAEWTTASVAELANKPLEGPRQLILSSISEAAHMRALAPAVGAAAIVGRWHGMKQLPTLMEGLGGALAEHVFTWLTEEYVDAEVKKELLTALSLLPADVAMDGLLDRLGDKYVLPAATEAVTRFPMRAVRLASARVAGRGKNLEGARRLLTSAVKRSPHAVAAVRDSLSDAQRAAIAAIEAERVTAPEASAEDLPSILVAPPWTQKKKRVKPTVIKDVAALDRPAAMAWAAGEKERWTASHKPPGYAVNVKPEEWTEMVAGLRAGKLPVWRHEMLLVGAPDEVAHEAVKDWLPHGPWYVDNYLRAAVARLELRTVEPLAYFLEHHLKDALRYIGPFDAPSFAPFVADAFARLKSARSDARAWMERHPEATIAGVIPAAVGKTGKARRGGEAALRYLKSQGHEARILAIAAEHSASVRDAVAEIIAIDPKDVLPNKIPTLPSFWDSGTLPTVLLKGRAKSLPTEVVDHLGTMLAISKPAEEYEGLDDVIEACDGESLSRFAWELFESWQAAGHPSKESWAFHALAIFGDDEIARRLTPLIRKWPGDGGHARAVSGLDVLASIGSDVALMHLHGIAQKVKFKGLQKNARAQIELIARARNLSAEALADRLVPDLGLDESGSLVLDYGPRQFTVGFDEQLKPFVLENGKPRKSLPKPGAKDDPDEAPAAYKRFSALKKDAKTAAASQILRLELAMIGQRRWTGAQLNQFFLSHPLMLHLSRRLVWARYDDGSVVGTFRVAEDGSLADAHDEAMTISDGDDVGIVHPLDLAEVDAKKWGDVFGDYEILQPFTQLGRETFAIDEGEKKKKSLERFKAQTVPTRKVIGLEGRGWRRGPPMDGGVVGWMQKQLPSGAWACLNLDPGLFTGYLDEEPQQTLDDLTITRSAEAWDSRGEVELGELGPVIFSELVRDIASLTEA